MPIGLNNNNKKNHYEITTKPLKPRLKNLDGKCNGVMENEIPIKPLDQMF
jgi:hypothetical protein